MNKQKQLKKTLKKLRLQRDAAEAKLDSINGSVEAVIGERLTPVEEARRQAQRAAERASMDVEELRTQLAIRDEQLEDERKRADGLETDLHNERFNNSAEFGNFRTEIEELKSKLFQQEQEVLKLNEELTKVREDNDARKLKKRMARKFEENRLLRVENERLNAELNTLQMLGRAVRLPLNVEGTQP